MVKGAKPEYLRRGARPLADIIGGPLNAVCRKRGFATLDLISHWPDIVGPVYGECTSPDRLVWPRRPQGLIEEERHEPAVLTVRCTGAAALRLAHEADQIIERINMFFGYRVVGRLKTLQLPPARFGRPERPRLGPVSAEDERAVKSLAAGIADEGLRAAVEWLARAVAAGRPPVTKN